SLSSLPRALCYASSCAATVPHPPPSLFPYTTLFRSQDFQADLQKLIRRVFTEHQRIIFNGNGYDDAWLEEAKKRGLYNLTSTAEDRKSTRLNSSHVSISYAVFCLKKKTTLTT